MPVTVAAAQMITLPGDVETNVARHVPLVERAAAEGARVVVFPEMSLTGYEPARAAQLALDPSADPRLEVLRRLAADRNVTVVCGAPLRCGTRLHIAAFLLAPDGAVGVYTKRFLGQGEDAWVSPGTLDPVLRVEGRTAAVAVCADANRPIHPARAAERGADLYLVSTFITPGQLDDRMGLLRGYAVEHGMTVVFANHGGPAGGLPSGGRSAAWGPDGQALAQLDGVGAGLVLATGGGDSWDGRVVPV